MEEFVDYYGLLGVTLESKNPEIETAFRKKVMELRPDINLDEKTREEFKKLQDARETLTDPVQSTIYMFKYQTHVLTAFGNYVKSELRKDSEFANQILRSK